MIETNFKYSFENRSKDGLLFALSYLSLSSAKALAFYTGIATAGVARVAELIEQGHRDGEWKLAQSKSVAVSIHSLMVGDISKMIVMPSEASASVRAKRCWRDVSKILGI